MTMTMRGLGCALLIGLLAGCSKSDNKDESAKSAAPQNRIVADINGDDIIALASGGGDWLNYGRGYAEQRFSPLGQITAENVGELGLAWSLDLDNRRGLQSTPLYHDGVLYATLAWSRAASCCGSSIRRSRRSRASRPAAVSTTAASRCGRARPFSARLTVV
jgi:glucose dehydrogenase